MLFLLIKVTYNSLVKFSKQKMCPALLSLFSEDIVVLRINSKIVPIWRLPPVYQNIILTEKKLLLQASAKIQNISTKTKNIPIRPVNLSK